jgi:predicted nucleic acid-binding protein
MVVVDTSVFSLFLRRDQTLKDEYLDLFLELFEKNQIVLLGVVYQELLSGIRHQKQFDRLADILDGFHIQYAAKEDHLTAARYYNLCRSQGVQGSSIDFLICAMSRQREHLILTLDEDFTHYAKHLPIRLLKPGF